MSVLNRSWVVILLWLATLFLALAMPAETSGGSNIFFHLNYLFGGLLLLSLPGGKVRGRAIHGREHQPLPQAMAGDS
jgi:hypothetical protein